MSLLKAAWVNFAASLFEQEVVEKLDAHQQANDDFAGSLPSLYLSKVNADTAAGVITFTPTPVVTTPAPVADAELTRKDYVDGEITNLGLISDSRYAHLDLANVFTATPQSIQSQSATGRPAHQLRDSSGLVAAEWWFNETAGENRVNISTRNDALNNPRPLFLQNREPGQTPFGGVVIGDNNATNDHGAGTLTAEVDLYIQENALTTTIADANRAAKKDEANTFTATPQSVQSNGATGRPAVQLRKSDGTLKLEMFYSESADSVNVLGYGSPLVLSPGSVNSVLVGSSVITNYGAGTLHALNDVYSDDGVLLRLRDGLTWCPVKGVAIQFDGALAIQHSYNVTGVTFQGAGVYRIEPTQSTVNGVSLTDALIPAVAVVAADAAGEAVFARFQPGAPAGFIDVFVYTLVISGQQLLDDPYDLGPNDIVWMSALINAILPGADPLPP